MNSETKKLHYASYDKKKSRNKGNKKKSSSSPATKSSVLHQRILNLLVLEDCIINAGSHTLRNTRQSARPKQPSAMVVVRLVITRTVVRRQGTSPRSLSIQKRCTL